MLAAKWAAKEQKNEKRIEKEGIYWESQYSRGIGIAQFNLATADGNTPEVRPLTSYILPCNLKTKPI